VTLDIGGRKDEIEKDEIEKDENLSPFFNQ
jgi:hypothetical protein